MEYTKNMIYLNCGGRELKIKKIVAVIAATFSVAKKDRKKSGLFGIQTPLGLTFSNGESPVAEKKFLLSTFDQMHYVCSQSH